MSRTSVFEARSSSFELEHNGNRCKYSRGRRLPQEYSRVSHQTQGLYQLQTPSAKYCTGNALDKHLRISFNAQRSYKQSSSHHKSPDCPPHASRAPARLQTPQNPPPLHRRQPLLHIRHRKPFHPSPAHDPHDNPLQRREPLCAESARDLRPREDVDVLFGARPRGAHDELDVAQAFGAHAREHVREPGEVVGV
ncbi:hypothetical protein C8Q73DRAFT_62840 [Cubamyces lactineus]|nr:hypothetical protein C8Q73DRAFT_62840 [Cubamyces lactineus]